jgi:outer membrane receptor protein involved in Fe transport
MRRNHLPISIIFTIAALHSTAVFAAAPETAEAELEGLESLSLEELLRIEVPTVVAASKRAEKSSQAPATTVVVTHDEIRLRGYAFLRDVLHDLPGMETTETYFSEFGTLVPVRGVVGNNKIIVLIDGMRVNPPGGEPMMFRSDISVRDAEQVEVIYGPGSTLYGQDAISAVVNIRTAKARDDRWLKIGSAGGWPLRYEGWLSANKRFGKLRVFANSHVFRARLTDLSKAWEREWNTTYRPTAELKTAGPGDERGVTDSRWDFGFTGLFKVEYGDARLQIWHRQSQRSSSEGLDGGFAKIDEARWGDMSTVIEARHRASLTEKVSLSSSLLFNRYEIDPKSRYVFEASPTEWFDDDWKYGLGIGATLEEQVVWDLGERGSVTGGLVVSHFDIQPKATIPGGADRSSDVTSQGGNLEYFVGEDGARERFTLARASNIVYQSVGGYVEAAIDIIPTLRLIAGLRLDYDTRIDEIPISPRLALVLRPRKELAIKGIFTQAWVAPPPYFSHNVFFNGVSVNAANPKLEPERARSIELALSWTAARFELALSIYYNEQENLLVTGDQQLDVNIVNDRIFTSETGGTPILLTHSANSGKSMAVGGELRGRVNPAKALSLWGSYSIVDFQTRREEGGTTVTSGLPGISRHNLRLGATVSPVAERLFISGSFSLRSTPENIPEFQNGQARTTLRSATKTPWELRLHVLYNPIEWLDVYLDLRNLTNHRYALAGLVGNAVPQEGFSGTLGLRWRH